MSRDLTCNETMPALDESESISDVRRLVTSRVLSQQPFTAQINLLSNSRANTNNSITGNISHTTTVRDVVSSRMRNKAVNNEPTFSSFNSSVNQPSSSYWIKTSGLQINSNTAETMNSNFLQTLMNETNKGVPQRQEASGGAVSQTSQNKHLFNNTHNSYSFQQLPNVSVPNPQLVTSILVQPKAVISKPMSNIGIAMSYNNSSSATSHSQETFANTCLAGSSSVSISPLRSTSSSNLPYATTMTTQSGLTGFVLSTGAPTVGNSNNSVYGSSNYLQRSSDSPSKILMSRQQLALASPLPAVFVAGSTQYLQQPLTRSSFVSEMSVGSVMRTSNASPSKTMSGSLARGASPYAVVLPQRSESVLLNVSRESPNGLSNQGSTTPTGGQNPPNSHSSPRPSILRSNNNIRRYVEKDATTSSAQTNFSAINFAGMDNNSITSINFAANSVVTSSTSSEDSVRCIPSMVTITTVPSSNFSINSSSGEDCANRQDDSPRKRQRKQQFDNSQQLQDKLMMEVRADPRFDQLGVENAALWKLTGGIFPSVQSTALKSGYSSGGEFSGSIALSSKEPRRRGRPRSINRNSADLYFPGSASPALLLPMSIALTSSFNSSYSQIGAAKSTYVNAPTVTYGTAPLLNTVSGNNTVAGTSTNNIVPRSFMVDVDSMLQVSPTAKRPRKYKKRTPELNPDTGEIVKKPRKKGSGRKSKKELLLIEAAKKGISLNLGSVIDTDSSRSFGELLSSTSKSVLTTDLLDFRQHYQQQASSSSSLNFSRSSDLQSSLYQPRLGIPSVSVFSRLAVDERSVVTTLCKFKSSFVSRASNQSDRKVSATDAEPTIKDVSMSAINTNLIESEIRQLINSKGYKKSLPDAYAGNLLDATKYKCLRQLWKGSDRSLANSLSENFEDIINYLSHFEKHLPVESFPLPQQLFPKFKNSICLARNKRSVLCPMFDTYEEFKTSLESLRLLPTTCKYFKSSKTLIDSLRSNLYGFSAYYLAKNLISIESNNIFENNVEKNNTKPITGLKPTDKRLQGTCEDLFEFLYKEMKNRFEAPSLQKNEKISSEQELFIDMDVAELLDSLTDSVDKITKNELLLEVKAEINDNSPSTSQNIVLLENFVDPLGVTSSMAALAFVEKMPKSYQSLLGVSTSHASSLPEKKRKKVMRRSRKYCESSSEGDQRLIKDCGEELTDDRKLEYLLQRLSESHERSYRFYRNSRKLALRLLEKLEPDRYTDAINFGKILNLHDKKMTKEHLETSFLLDIPKYSSTFKSLNIYNSGKSVVLHPNKELVYSIFKEKYPYGFLQNKENKKFNGITDSSNRVSRLKSSAVERLRETEANYLVLDEIKEMAQNTTHISSVSLARLQRKYGEKREFSNINGIMKMHSFYNAIGDKKSVNSDSADLYSEFDRSLKRVFPHNSHASQLNFFQERCKETHELAAVVLGLSHSKANILCQCHEALLEIKTMSGMNGRLNATADLDVEVDLNKSHINYDDADDTAGSSASDHEFDQTSDEDDHHNNTRHCTNFSVNSSFNNRKNCGKKRRWPFSNNNMNTTAYSSVSKTSNIPKRFDLSKRSSADIHSDEDTTQNINHNANLRRRLSGKRLIRTPTPNYGVFR